MAEDAVVQVEEENQENSTSVYTRKELLVFWLRMVGWIMTAVIAPVSVFSIKFGLFQQYGYQVNTDELGNVTEVRIALNGWGIISIILIVFAALTVINEVIDAYEHKYTYIKQILIGIKEKIIPITAGIAICFWLKGVLEQVIFCLTTIGICQIAAICLNPLPEWKHRVKGEEDYADCLSTIAKYFKRKMKQEDEGGK